jgi:hypothetical protein
VPGPPPPNARKRPPSAAQTIFDRLNLDQGSRGLPRAQLVVGPSTPQPQHLLRNTLEDPLYQSSWAHRELLFAAMPSCLFHTSPLSEHASFEAVQLLQTVRDEKMPLASLCNQLDFHAHSLSLSIDEPTKITLRERLQHLSRPLPHPRGLRRARAVHDRVE